MAQNPLTVFVGGATGIQGGGAVKALLAGNHKCHALTRNTSSEAALALKDAGVEVFPGNYDDIEALKTAMKGCNAVFLNATLDYTDIPAEVRWAKNILAAAKETGTIKHVVSSTVYGAGDFEKYPDYNEHLLMTWYYRSKAGVEAAVRDAGSDWLQYWTLLRPAAFGTNFFGPNSVPFYFPELPTQGIMLNAYRPETKIAVIYGKDVGKFVRVALEDPAKFTTKGVPVVSEYLSIEEIAAAISKASGKNIKAVFRPEEEVEALFNKNMAVTAQRVVANALAALPYSEHPEKYGLDLYSFEEMLKLEEEALKETLIMF